MMRERGLVAIRREDYTVPPFFIRSVELCFELDPVETRVVSLMIVERNPAAPAQPLRLHGERLTLTSVQVDGRAVSFRDEDGLLTIDSLKDAPLGPFRLEIRNTCCPQSNTELSGLYASNGGLFTQCEAEGFRRITFFLDRPDVMSIFTVTLRASRAAYPVLLSNGNLVEEGSLEPDATGARHYATWHDPFPKPSYLFALVAADLVAREQTVRARSGKEHLLQVWVRRGDLDKTEHAMRSLVAAIAWDEARFALPLDLDRFMIVAVGDFNMGAMENKGLNIFNTKFVLASPATATDANYTAIESVVGHEYFHNWTGNRVTCRDWFQLSLKEGLTVFRDQEFSMDMSGSESARAVKRIEDVRRLRVRQFPEDAGPMAHPVRPESYVEIDNFYTATVYEKGAEVVRMMSSLVGQQGFARGMSLYFSRFDGQAVTCEDFAHAIADANPESELARTLPQFLRWYSQAGTPTLRAKGKYDAGARTYTLELEQSAGSAAAVGAQPFVIPIAMGLLRRDGSELPLRLAGEANAAGAPGRVLVLEAARGAFTFVDVDSEPVPSLLRGFSAPVRLIDGMSDADLLIQLQHDPDPFCRYEAGQRLALDRLLAVARSGATLELDSPFVEAIRAVLSHPQLAPAFKDLVLAVPIDGYIAEQLAVVDPLRIHAARQAMLLQLAGRLRDDWQRAFDENRVTGPYTPGGPTAARRALANRALAMLCLDAVERGDTTVPARAFECYSEATNMTDRQGALAALVHSHAALAQPAIDDFYRRFRAEPLVIDMWFAMQAMAPERDGRVFERCKALLTHPDFSLRTPNRVRSLVDALCGSNPSAFHRVDGAGYEFWADRVIDLDAINPQTAAPIARLADRWSKLAPPYHAAARAAVARVAAKADLSKNVREIVTHTLESSRA